MEVAKSRKHRLRACEMVLAEHMEEFVSVGLALKEIKDDGLYEDAGFQSFPEYLKSNENRFGIQKSYAYELIAAAETRMRLPSPEAPDSGWSVKLMREIRRIESPTKQKAVGVRVVREANKNDAGLTLSFVRKHVDKELGVDHKPKPRPAPKFDESVLRWTGQLNGIADLLNSVSDEDLQYFGKTKPVRAKELASAIERVEKSLERIWATLP